jgi:hypothetical protein
MTLLIPDIESKSERILMIIIEKEIRLDKERI